MQALADAGFLQIAEDELEDGRGAPGVRLHFLAALQNMAACVDQSGLEKIVLIDLPEFPHFLGAWGMEHEQGVILKS